MRPEQVQAVSLRKWAKNHFESQGEGFFVHAGGGDVHNNGAYGKVREYVHGAGNTFNVDDFEIFDPEYGAMFLLFMAAAVEAGDL